MATQSDPPHPRVGVAAIIHNPSNPSEILLGKRISSHGRGTWQFPGGHLEYGEEIFMCAERETLEETGLKVRAKRLVATTNSVFVSDRKHYITLFVECEMMEVDAVAEVLEPEKCESWHWIKWATLSEWVDHQEDQSEEWSDKKCFLPIVNLLKEDRESTGLRGMNVNQ